MIKMIKFEIKMFMCGFRYAVSDGLLFIGIERARNLSALFIPQHSQV